MSFTAPEDTFLDVKDANLRVYGNVHADGLKLGQVEVVTTTSTGSTIQFLHQHTALTTTSNIEVGTTNHDLFVDTSTSRVGILTNTPTATLDVNGAIKGSFLDVVGDINFTGNLTQGGSSYILPVGGTGSLTVPSGDTGQRPVPAVNGMLRYNSTIGFMEAYTVAGWAPIAQPPTVTGISPLTTLPSAGVSAGWDTGTKFVSPDAVATDLMGLDAKNMSMSADGTKYIVGVPTYNRVIPGAAYIFTYSSGSWDTGTKIEAPSPVNGDDFGYSVYMNSDGTKVIVGTRGDATTYTKQGAAYIFTYSSGSWDAGTKIVASDAATGNQFGTSVTMSGDGTKVVVGAFSVNNWNIVGFGYYFTLSGSSWTQQQKITTTSPALAVNDYFFWDCNMNTAGTKMIVGALGYDLLPPSPETGAAFIFTLSGSSWSQEAYLAPPTSDRQNGDQFGRSVAMSGDGTTVIMGMLNDDTSAGAAYIFTYSSGSWDAGTKIVAADAETNNKFGTDVAINSDGTMVVVGSPSHVYSGPRYGTAYRFTYSSGAWDTGTKILASDPTGGDEFGASVAMNSDGTKILVGARRDDDAASDAGAVYLFGYNPNQVFDASTQVFTATGTGIVSGSTVQLEGADGTLYSVFDTTPPNAAGTQVTFKMGTLGASGAFTIANQPYKIRVNSTSGLTGTSTAAIGFAVGWTTAAGTNLDFNIAAITTQTLVGTDGGGGTNRTFSISPLSAVQALPSDLTLTGAGVINGQIAADQLNITTPVTFRLTDNGSGQFEDRAINIVGSSGLYPMAFPFTFTNAGVTGRTGPTLTDLTIGSDAYSPTWTDYTSNLNVTAGIQEWTVPTSGTYQITAAGAASSGGSNGAIMRGDFTLTRGEIIKILVGQKSIVGTYTLFFGVSVGAGGGGGTFVIRTPYNSTGSILVIAGGGGGTTMSADGSSQNIGQHGTTSNNGQDAETTDAGTTGAGGTSGNGGQNTDQSTGQSGAYACGGGGGFSGNGLPSYSGSSSPQTAALSFTNGGTGGADTGSYPRGNGGFGGGAAASYSGGAGGGGYSGGGGVSTAGQNVDATKNGGGGGSYNSGTNQSNSAGASSGNSGHGSVIITKL